MQDETVYSNKLYVVLGMHRSGTSALTRGLVSLGLNLGDNLMPPKADNSKGFWEDMDINALNIEMLNEIGFLWNDGAFIEVEHVDRLQRCGFTDMAKELLKAKIKSFPNFSFKDPRTLKLLPFWKNVFSDPEFDVSYIFSLRHPKSVAASLCKRNGFLIEEAYLLWFAYNLEFLRIYSSNSCIVVDYDILLNNPEKELRRIAYKFNLDVNNDALASYMDEFIDSEFRHTLYSEADLYNDFKCPAFISEMYALLLGLSKFATHDELAALNDKLKLYLDRVVPDASFINLLNVIDYRKNHLRNILNLSQDELKRKDTDWEQRLSNTVHDFEAEILRVANERDQMLAEKDVAWEKRLSTTVKDFEAELSRVAAERDHMLANKDRAWEERLSTAAKDFEAELARIAAERDHMLADKDRAWEDRLSTAAKDFEAELARMAAERDHMLADKDRAWEDRLSTAAKDFEAELARKAAERDHMLADKDRAWEDRLSTAAKDFEAELARIAAERDQMLADKDKAWEDRLSTPAKDFETELARIAAERDHIIINKDHAWEERLSNTVKDFEAELTRVAAERDHMLVDKDHAWEERLSNTVKDFEAKLSRVAAERDHMLVDKDQAWEEQFSNTVKDFETELSRVAAERDHMLIDKDQAWSVRLSSTARDFELQIANALKEHHQALIEKEALFVLEKDGIYNAHSNELNKINAQHASLIKENNDYWSIRMSKIVPAVSVVIVNYNGKHFLEKLLTSLMQQTLAAAEVIIVDNASIDGSCSYVKENFPWVKLIESKTNTGFAGGNNLGVKHAISPLIALLNNDTLVDPHWLEYLVACWVQKTAFNMKVGAVSPKIRFKERFINFKFISDTFVPSELDTRNLGVALDLNNSHFVGCDYLKPLIKDGFYTEEKWPENRLMRWTNGSGSIMLPFSGASSILSFSLFSPKENVEVNIYAGEILIKKCILKNGFNLVQCELDENVTNGAFWVINNAGSKLDGFGNAADIGINEPDIGQYDRPGRLEAFCGCSCLISKEFFFSMGGFDERLFMYYEDSDLSWRMRRAGYSIEYEPASIVRHVHAGSSVEWSPSFRYHVVRNHKLINIKNTNIVNLPRAIFIIIFLVLKNIYKFGISGYRYNTLQPINTLTPEQIECKAVHDAFKMSKSILLSRLKLFK